MFSTNAFQAFFEIDGACLAQPSHCCVVCMGKKQRLLCFLINCGVFVC